MKKSDRFYKEDGSTLYHEILASEQEDLDYEIYFTAHSGAMFYFEEDDKYIAVDNSDEQCYVEEFNTSEEAIAWLSTGFKVEA